MELLIQSKPMSKWDRRFCELAKYVAEWSKDQDAKVGAVVFSKRGGEISIGYNGFPMGVEDSADRLQDKELKLELIVHAEVNALIAAGAKSSGATLYVWGKPICARCAGPIIQSGIKRIVAPSFDSVPEASKWHKTGEYACEMFREAGIHVDFFVVENGDEA
jgi:dCMP deaminase